MVRRMLLAAAVLLVACFAVFVARRTYTMPTAAGSPRPAGAAKKPGHPPPDTPAPSRGPADATRLRTKVMPEATTEPSAVVTRYGRFRERGGSLTPRTGTSGGVIGNGGRSMFVETTRTIPCTLGESWGFEFELRGLPTDRAVEYRSEMHHPPIRQPDGTTMRVSVVRITVKPGDPPPTGEHWSFLKGFEYELVPGTWTRRVYIDDVEVVSVEFEVEGPVRLEPAPPGRPLVLGVRYESSPVPVGEMLKRSAGATVIGVFQNSPAQLAGIRPGDVIERVGGFEIGTAADLHFALDESSGKAVDLRVSRDNEGSSLHVKLLSRAKDGATPTVSQPASLHAAVTQKDLRGVEDVLRAGAKVNELSEHGWGALHLAANLGQSAIARMLLDHGAAPNIRDAKRATVPLHAACSEGHLVLARMLLARGANVSSRSKDGMRPLHLAAAGGRREMALMLIQAGAKVDAAKRSGWTPLLDAANRNHPAVVRLLLANDASTEAADQKGGTALHIAAGKGFLEVVRQLALGGANLDAIYDGRFTARGMAATNGHGSVVDYLRVRGAQEAVTAGSK